MSHDAELKLIQAVERVRELHKPRDKTCYQEVTIGYPDGTQTIDQREVTVCDWCQYLVDFPNDYSTGGVAPYPCPTIKALDGEQS